MPKLSRFERLSQSTSNLARRVIRATKTQSIPDEPTPPEGVIPQDVPQSLTERNRENLIWAYHNGYGQMLVPREISVPPEYYVTSTAPHSSGGITANSTTSYTSIEFSPDPEPEIDFLFSPSSRQMRYGH